jgi:hypothetical protein
VPSYCMRTDWRTDRHDEANSRFWSFFWKSLKIAQLNDWMQETEIPTEQLTHCLSRCIEWECSARICVLFTKCQVRIMPEIQLPWLKHLATCVCPYRHMKGIASIRPRQIPARNFKFFEHSSYKMYSAEEKLKEKKQFTFHLVLIFLNHYANYRLSNILRKT